MASGSISSLKGKEKTVTIYDGAADSDHPMPSGISAITFINIFSNDFMTLVMYDITISANPTSSYQNIATGLPAANKNTYSSVAPWTSSATGAGLRIGATTSGLLRIASGIASTRYVGSFVYFNG